MGEWKVLDKLDVILRPKSIGHRSLKAWSETSDKQESTFPCEMFPPLSQLLSRNIQFHTVCLCCLLSACLHLPQMAGTPVAPPAMLRAEIFNHLSTYYKGRRSFLDGLHHLSKDASLRSATYWSKGKGKKNRIER